MSWRAVHLCFCWRSFKQTLSQKISFLNINTVSFTDTVALLRLLYFDWTILHVFRASLCQSNLFSLPRPNSSLVMKCTGPFSKSALKQIRLSTQTGFWPTKTTKIKLKTNSQPLKPQRLFSEKTSELWQWLLTNAPFSDSSGAQKAIRPGSTQTRSCLQILHGAEKRYSFD